MFYIYKGVPYFPSAPTFLLLMLLPGRFRNDALYYIFWTQESRSHYQRTAGHVGHYGSLQQSAAVGRGGQLAASGMKVSKPKSYYVYLASTSETADNFFGNCKLALALQSLLEVLVLPSYLQIAQISLDIICCGRLKSSA